MKRKSEISVEDTKTYSYVLNHCQQMRAGTVVSALPCLVRILISVHKVYSMNNADRHNCVLS
jgi:hypothetical protein